MVRGIKRTSVGITVRRVKLSVDAAFRTSTSTVGRSTAGDRPRLPGIPDCPAATKSRDVREATFAERFDARVVAARDGSTFQKRNRAIPRSPAAMPTAAEVADTVVWVRYTTFVARRPAVVQRLVRNRDCRCGRPARLQRIVNEGEISKVLELCAQTNVCRTGVTAGVQHIPQRAAGKVEVSGTVYRMEPDFFSGQSES